MKNVHEDILNLEIYLLHLYVEFFIAVVLRSSLSLHQTAREHNTILARMTNMPL